VNGAKSISTPFFSFSKSLGFCKFRIPGSPLKGVRYLLNDLHRGERERERERETLASRGDFIDDDDEIPRR